MFRVVQSPIFRSANNCIYSISYLSHHYCYIAAGSNGVSLLVSLLQVFGIKFVWTDYPSRGFCVSSPIRYVTNNWRRVDS